MAYRKVKSRKTSCPTPTLTLTTFEGHLTLSELRSSGGLVPLECVGGAMLLVRADLYREGVVFPSYPYKRRIETEGFSFMASDAGYRSWGIPNLEVIHL